jgi:hypothetical protein
MSSKGKPAAAPAKGVHPTPSVHESKEAEAAPAAPAPPPPPPPPPAITYGSGRFVYPIGEVYEGEFMCGASGVKQRHGRGRFSGPHFSYDGTWHEDVMHGEGTFIGSSGCVYTGALDRGVYHGEGRYRWPDGATYEGGWLRGKLHGKGTYTSALGLLFSGEFVNGLFQQTPTSLVAVR